MEADLLVAGGGAWLEAWPGLGAPWRTLRVASVAAAEAGARKLDDMTVVVAGPGLRGGTVADLVGRVRRRHPRARVVYGGAAGPPDPEWHVVQPDAPASEVERVLQAAQATWRAGLPVDPPARAYRAARALAEERRAAHALAMARSAGVRPASASLLDLHARPLDRAEIVDHHLREDQYRYARRGLDPLCRAQHCHDVMALAVRCNRAAVTDLAARLRRLRARAAHLGIDPDPPAPTRRGRWAVALLVAPGGSRALGKRLAAIEGTRVHWARSLAEAEAIFARGIPVVSVLVATSPSNGSGLDLLVPLRRHHPAAPVVLYGPVERPRAVEGRHGVAVLPGDAGDDALAAAFGRLRERSDESRPAEPKPEAFATRQTLATDRLEAILETKVTVDALGDTAAVLLEDLVEGLSPADLRTERGYTRDTWATHRPRLTRTAERFGHATPMALAVAIHQEAAVDLAGRVIPLRRQVGPWDSAQG